MRMIQYRMLNDKFLNSFLRHSPRQVPEGNLVLMCTNDKSIKGGLESRSTNKYGRFSIENKFSKYENRGHLHPFFPCSSHIIYSPLRDGYFLFYSYQGTSSYKFRRPSNRPANVCLNIFCTGVAVMTRVVGREPNSLSVLRTFWCCWPATSCSRCDLVSRFFFLVVRLLSRSHGASTHPTRGVP